MSWGDPTEPDQKKLPLTMMVAEMAMIQKAIVASSSMKIVFLLMFRPHDIGGFRDLFADFAVVGMLDRTGKVPFSLVG